MTGPPVVFAIKKKKIKKKKTRPSVRKKRTNKNGQICFQTLLLSVLALSDSLKGHFLYFMCLLTDAVELESLERSA